MYAIADDSVGNRSGVFKHEIRNLPPNVETARASVDALWPPDHSMLDISVFGVTDPDCDPVAITIIGITQDEPTNDSADGDICPDAQN